MDHSSLRVVVAEDSLLIREGVVRVLETAGFDVVAEASDGDELARGPVASAERCRRRHPDAADAYGRGCARREGGPFGVAGHWCAGALSAYVEEGYVLRLLADGAEGMGYLLKDRIAEPQSLADAVRRVADGGSALDPEVVAQMLGRPRSAGPLDLLSEREREILARMAEGLSNRAIAEALGLGERVVERHVSTIFDKLALPAGARGHRRVLAVLTYLRD